jgi:DNA-binding transcriptional ArsR family regulator
VSRVTILLRIALVLAVANTFLLGLHLAIPDLMNTASQGASAGSGGTGYSISGAISSTAVPSHSAFQFLLGNSPALSATSWALVGGVWIWRGRVKSRWEGLGFDSGTFDLFIKMKGAKTRLNLLDALSMPKDRLQLAQQLGLDWKAVDYHIVLLNKYGLVHEDQAYGRVKMYRLTTLGETLLQLLKEFDREIDNGSGSVSTQAPNALVR